MINPLLHFQALCTVVSLRFSKNNFGLFSLRLGFWIALNGDLPSPYFSYLSKNWQLYLYLITYAQYLYSILISKNIFDFILEKLKEHSNMKIPEMVKFFKENYNVKVSRSIVWRALIESNYSYAGPKIRLKNTDKEKKKRLKWGKRQLFQN